MKLFARMTILPVLGISCLLPSVEVVAQTAPAKIAYVEGKVFIKRGVDGTVEEAEVGTGVFRGDTVLTKPGGRAQVNLAASGVLRLSANTTISFPLGYDPTERIGVLYTGGKPWVDVKKLIREEIFEARTPTLVAGCSDAVHGDGPLSDYVVGMPVSDEELQQSMNAGGVKSSWPSSHIDASKDSRVGVILEANLMLSVPGDLPQGWWPNRFTEPFPRLEGVPQRVTNEGTPYEWEQYFSISNETGAEWDGSGYRIVAERRMPRFMTVSAFLQPRYSIWIHEGKTTRIDDRERLEALVANNPDCRWFDKDHTANIWLRDGNLAEVNFVHRDVSAMLRVAFPNGARDTYSIDDCTSVVKHFHQVMLKKIDVARRHNSFR